MKMNLRLALAIITSLLDEAIIIGLILWGLPKLGIEVPLLWLVVISVGFVLFAVFCFRMGTRALSRKPVAGFTTMIGTRGRVVAPLVPEGFVKIKGELWDAKATGEDIDIGADIVVVGQEEGLKLIVRRITAGDLEKTE